MINSAAKQKKCLEDGAMELCLRRRIKQMLSDMVEVWKRVARVRLLPLRK